MKTLTLPLLLVFILVSILSSCTTTSNTTTPVVTVPQELSTSEIVEMVSPAVAYIETNYGIGTGIVIDERGYILTNNHVVGAEDYATVILPNKQEVTAQVVYRDENLDIAIIKCPGSGYPYVPLGSSDNPSIGGDVVAMGHPVGVGESASISKGIISAVRTIEGTRYIQTDASANPGSSGGPLFNTYGEFIGMVTWGVPETEGINFAIEINSIKTYIEDILQQLIGGGVSTKTVTQTITQTVEVPTFVAPDGTTFATFDELVTYTEGLPGGVEVITKFTCPYDDLEFATVAALGAHLDVVHGGKFPAVPTITVTITTTVTATPTTTPTPTTTTPNIVFSFTGIGQRNTPPFSISTSPWILQYSTNFSGTFIVYLGGDNTSEVIGLAVTADVVYETYIYDKTGNLYFRILNAPSDGEWTLTVINLS